MANPTRDSVLEDIKTRLNYIKNTQSYWDGKYVDAQQANNEDNYNQAIGHILNMINIFYYSVFWFAYRRYDTEERHMLWYFLNNYTIDEAEITAGAILTAWIEADKNTRLFTVLTLDELRREVWDEEFTTFRIAPPPG